jgi:uncharacterized protein (UPF0262 family)
MTSDRQARLVAVEIDETGLPAPTPEIEQERRVAIWDLLEENSFLPRAPGAADGPYRLVLAVRQGQIHLDIRDESGGPVDEVLLPLAALAQIIRDYFAICESYFEAVRHRPPAEIEALDAARRQIHDEATRLLRERLADRIDMDAATARRLFTLIGVLHAQA